MNLLIIQARMGSSRLPGKVLRLVGDKPLLGLLLQRLAPSKLIDRTVVAITLNPVDDILETFCKDHLIPFFRGSENDVLDRFYQCAVRENLGTGDTVIRICCDNPLHSWKVLDAVLNQFIYTGVDYFSNSNKDPNFLEDGFDVEVCSFDALARAWREAERPSEREHVMPYIKNSGHFSLGWRKTCKQYRYKLSVDTENDLRAVQAILEALSATPDFSIEDVALLLESRPDILEINKESIINAGYQKSLEQEKKQ